MTDLISLLQNHNFDFISTDETIVHESLAEYFNNNALDANNFADLDIPLDIILNRNIVEDLGTLELDISTIRKNNFLEVEQGKYTGNTYKFEINDIADLTISLDLNSNIGNANIALFFDSNNNDELDLNDILNLDESNAIFPNADDDFITYERAEVGTYFTSVVYINEEDDSSLDYQLNLSAQAGQLAKGLTVYRFYNSSLGSHFYTVDEVERDYVNNNLDNYAFEGESYVTVDEITGSSSSSSSSPEAVYRFFNRSTGVHLYTASEHERDNIINNLPDFSYEDVKFHAYATEELGTVPVYRFYEPNIGVHFYTPNEGEKMYIEENLFNYNYEGIAYYVFQN